MSYGHGHDLAGQPFEREPDDTLPPAEGGRQDTHPIAPALIEHPDVRAAAAAHEIGKLYRLLKDLGNLSQREIGQRTGQSQSQISAILKGRQVIAYTLLERICEGFGIPRAYMGLSYYGRNGTYHGTVPVAEPPKGVDEAMERRTAVGTLAFAVFGTPLLRFGEQLAELVVPATGPLPSRLSMAHVAEVEAETERLRDTGRQFGGQADAFCFAVARFTRWLGVPADDRVKAALGRALSELCTEAGWWCWDSGVSGLGFFTRAMRLADDARDGYGIVNAAWHAGATLVRSGHPDEALQCFQIGQSQIEGSWPGKSNPAILPKDDPRVPARAARLNLNSATAYALMDDPKQARNYLARARDGWAPRDAFERAYGDSATAGVELDLGRIEAAEPFAQAAVRTYHGAAHHRSRVLAELRLAEVHVRAGEPRGLTMARAAIDAVAPLRSVPVRRERLVPLADALDARPGSDARELAARARKVAAARG